MYFDDLTDYQYIPGFAQPGLVNVGWLDTAHPYATGATAPEFLNKLFEICARHWTASTRGHHYCPFCQPLEPMRLNAALRKQLLETRDGEDVGASAEIRVRGVNGRSYAAPTMIYHYCLRHEYLPPAEFVQAVLTYELGCHDDPSWCEACSRRAT